MCSMGLEYFILTQWTKLMKELLIENTIDTVSDFVQVLPFVGNKRVGERQRLLFHLHRLIGKMNLATAFYQHDFVKIPSSIRDAYGLTLHERLEAKQIEVTDFMAEVLGYPIKFSLIEALDRLRVIHFLKLQNSNRKSFV